MRQVVAALSRASQQGIIHRDIKPENIMLARTGEVKVADFGLARVTTDGQAVNLTQVGVTMGTPLYMSPEQVEGRPVDPRSDLYSFGVTCYEMLAGRPPFEGETPLSVAVQHLRTEPERLENLRPDLPEGLCRIVHRLLAKNPADRYPDAGGSDARPARAATSMDLSNGRRAWTNGMRRNCWRFPKGVRKPPCGWRPSCGRRRSVARRRVLGVWIGAGRGRRPAARVRPAPGSTVPPTCWMSYPAVVERKESAKLQYWHAMKLNTEEAWLAVERYFPQRPDTVNRVYAWLAKQRLAEFYRGNGQLDDAMQLYYRTRRVRASRSMPRYGLIGKANLLDEQGQKELATAELVEAVDTCSPNCRRRNRSAACCSGSIPTSGETFLDVPRRRAARDTCPGIELSSCRRANGCSSLHACSARLRGLSEPTQETRRGELATANPPRVIHH